MEVISLSIHEKTCRFSLDFEPLFHLKYILQDFMYKYIPAKTYIKSDFFCKEQKVTKKYILTQLSATNIVITYSKSVWE